MNVMLLRAKIKPESVADVEAAVTTMFSAIERARLEGVCYASCRLADTATFVILLQVQDGIQNPLPTVPEFREFQDNLKNWITEPPTQNS